MPGRRHVEQPSVAIVTDSTASLPEGAAERWGIGVVPLDVVVDGVRHVEGVDLTPGDAARRARPAGAQGVDVAAAARRVRRGLRPGGGVRRAGDRLDAPVRRAVGHGPGGPARRGGRRPCPSTWSTRARSPWRSGSRCSTRRGSPSGRRRRASPPRGGRTGRRGACVVARPRTRRAASCRPAPRSPSAAARSPASTRVWFLVDSLDHLRRGGRLSIPAAAIGIVLGLRPILTLDDGRIEVHREGAHAARRPRPAGRPRRRRDRAHARTRASPCTTSGSRSSRRRSPSELARAGGDRLAETVGLRVQRGPRRARRSRPAGDRGRRRLTALLRPAHSPDARRPQRAHPATAPRLRVAGARP